jgi:hypothetical protein
MSVSLTLMQASLLPAYSDPSGAIWQKLSGADNNAKTAPKRTAKPSTQRAAARTNVVPASSQPVLQDPHAMLFLKGKQGAVEGAVAPAAALTIHPAMSDDAVAEDTSKSALVASNDVGAMPAAASLAPAIPAPGAAPGSDAVLASAPPVSTPAPTAAAGAESAIKSDQAASQATSQQLLAQLAPDQVVAQAAEQGGTLTATPIPPVVTGTVDLEEFKTTNVIELKTSQSRTFKLKNKIVRTSISDPAIAEPVVVSENQIVLLGKTP